MKKVLVFGTFDIFHPGHWNFLGQARKYGDHLTVVIARDQTVRQIKGRFPDNKEQQRLARVQESNLANKVLLGRLGDKYQIIKEVQPDFICLGYDQKSFNEGLNEKLMKQGLKGVKIIKLYPYQPEKYKSSKLRILKK